MTVIESRREGFALAAAVLAMMVVGAIVTGGFYAASHEHKIASSSDAADMALYIAETGLTARLGTTTAVQYKSLGAHVTMTSGWQDVTYGGRTVGRYQTRILRLSELLFMVESNSEVTLQGPFKGAKRSVGTLVRIRNVDFETDAAIQVYGGLTVSGNADIIGSDYVAPSWTGCNPSATSDAVAANPTSEIIDAGSGEIFPENSIRRDTLVEDDFKVYGDVTFEEIAALANIRYTNDVSVGPQPTYTTVGGTTVCNTQDPFNWGHPTSTTDPCKNYFPIIEAQGSVTVPSNGVGQGILLVRGDLHVIGSLTFYGVVVVLGSTDLAGAGTTVYGTIYAFGGGDPSVTNTALGNSDTQYSSCAIQRAVNGNNRLARGTPVKHRSWVDVSAVRNSY